jgi:hypothetical protein
VSALPTKEALAGSLCIPPPSCWTSGHRVPGRVALGFEGLGFRLCVALPWSQGCYHTELEVHRGVTGC